MIRHIYGNRLLVAGHVPKRGHKKSPIWNRAFFVLADHGFGVSSAVVSLAQFGSVLYVCPVWR